MPSVVFLVGWSAALSWCKAGFSKICLGCFCSSNKYAWYVAAKVLVLRWRSIWYPCSNLENKVNFRNLWSNVCSIRWFVNTSTRNTRLFDCHCPPEIYLPSERKVEIWSQLSVGPAFSKIQVIKKSIKWIQAYQLSYSKFNSACSPSLIFSSNYL